MSLARYLTTGHVAARQFHPQVAESGLEYEATQGVVSPECPLPGIRVHNGRGETTPFCLSAELLGDNKNV